MFLFTGNVCSANIFDSDSVLEISVAYDISKLQLEKEDLREKGLPGKITTVNDNKIFNVEVLSRGKGSFDCQQPQLGFIFNKKENKGTLFEGLKKIKLFTKGTCLENKQDDEQDKQIIANYLIYKLYEEFTEYSFKTRLLKIRYSDTSAKIADYIQFGFFLEPVNSIEKRFNFTQIELLDLLTLKEGILALINTPLLSKVNAFEFFIANFDYGIPGYYSHIINDSGNTPLYYGEKNSKMFKSQSGEIFPFIYDFDFSRFGYFGPMCMFGYRFFMGEEFNPDCSADVFKETFQEDLKRFTYGDDVKKNSSGLAQAFTQWEIKQKDLIGELGSEYRKGMIEFMKAFEIVFKEAGTQN
jgi:hypothetical protein